MTHPVLREACTPSQTCSSAAATWQTRCVSTQPSHVNQATSLRAVGSVSRRPWFSGSQDKVAPRCIPHMTGARAGGAAHGHRVDHVHDPCPRQWPHFQPCGDWAKWPEREDGEWPLKMSFLSDRVSDEGFMLPALYLVHGVHERDDQAQLPKRNDRPLQDHHFDGRQCGGSAISASRSRSWGKPRSACHCTGSHLAVKGLVSSLTDCDCWCSLTDRVIHRNRGLSWRARDW